MIALINANADICYILWLDWDKISTDDCEVMVVNAENIRCVDRSIDEAQKVLLPSGGGHVVHFAGEVTGKVSCFVSDQTLCRISFSLPTPFINTLFILKNQDPVPSSFASL